MNGGRACGMVVVAALAAVFGPLAEDAAAQERRRGDRDRGRLEEIIFGPRDAGVRADRTEPRVVCRRVDGARICTVERERGDRDREGRVGRRGRDIDVGRRGRVGGMRAAGPPFCRNGRGHPVFGMRWCIERGFGRSSGGILEDIILRRPRAGRIDRTLDRGDLADILGDIILGRFSRYARAVGAEGPLHGRWRDDGALRLLARDRPLAELLDRDGDGRLDAVRLHEPD